MTINYDAEAFRLEVGITFADPTHKLEVGVYNYTRIRSKLDFFSSAERRDAKSSLDKGSVQMGVKISAWGECYETEKIVVRTVKKVEEIARKYGGIRIENTGKPDTLTDLCDYMPRGAEADPVYRFPRHKTCQN